MKTLEMNEQLLSIICMIQSAKKLFVNENDLVRYGAHIKDQAYTKRMGSDDDWLTRTRNYFFAIDDTFVKSLGLTKNEYCFKALHRYEVTDAMMNTNHDELYKFSFTY